ncbi:MAG: Lrp/AsnC family transcriptional regulator [Promethearchaeota archaeon]
MKIKERDLEILNNLLNDSRKPYIQVSKETGIPDTTIHFRINKLKEQEILRKFTLEVDLEKVGFLYQVVVILQVGNHITEDISKINAKALIQEWKKDSKIGFLALGEDEKTIIALIITNNKEKLDKILQKIKNEKSYVKSEIIFLNCIKKYNIEKIKFD